MLQLKECIDNLKQILPGKYFDIYFICFFVCWLMSSAADATVSRLEHCYGVITDREKDFVTAAGTILDSSPMSWLSTESVLFRDWTNAFGEKSDSNCEA